MKQSIILKTLLILGSVFIVIFIGSNYLTQQSDKKLIEKIRNYNLTTAMAALDNRLENQLKTNKKQMLDTIKMIVKNSSVFLLNFDKEGLEKSLKFDINKDGIEAIVIFDSVVNENFLIVYKNHTTIKVTDSLPKKFENLTKLSEPIYQTNNLLEEKIGAITLYYDESIIKNEIAKLKVDTKKKISEFNFTIDNELKKVKMMKLYIAISSFLLILIVSSILLVLFVNNPLRKLKIGLDNFFLFLQNKTDSTQKIELNTKDEFGQMAQNLNENIIVSAKLHEEIHELNTNLEKRIEEKTSKVTTLLDNAGQGFLTFDTDFIVDEEYSKECIKLLGKDIAHKDITNLLFKDKSKKELFKITLINALNDDIEIKRNAYISLLPRIILLNKKAVKLEYKIVENSKYMLVLTNITSQKKLEKKIKKEQEILKMIVAIVSESEVFYEVKQEYEIFINNFMKQIDLSKTPLFNITNIYRIIHTFKGTFAQIYMQDIVTFLHHLESDISTLQKETTRTNEDVIQLLEISDFESSLEKNISIIEDILGSEFLDSDNYLKIELNDIVSLQEKIEKILENYNHTTPECQDILCQVQKLSGSKLMTLFHPYISSTSQLANRLEKEIYEIEIIGDNKLVVNDKFKPFIKSLIHIFRNSVDHGIEMPEIRVENNKDEKGTISCNFEIKEDKLIIVISDDGAGIDIEKMKEKLKNRGIETQNIDNSEIYNFIFDDNLSTKDEVSSTSGRGVGMSVVKEECEKLNGKVYITSQKNVGTTFEFVIPL